MVACTLYGPIFRQMPYIEQSEEFKKLKKVMRKELNDLVKRGCKMFYCVLTPGVGIVFSEMVLELREKGQVVGLAIYKPDEAMIKTWPVGQTQRMRKICNSANYVNPVDVESCEQAFIMADHVLAVLEHYKISKSDLRIAIKEMKSLTVIDPENYKVRRIL